MYSPLAKRNIRQKEFVLSIDYAPTILELGRAEIGSHIQGRSIIPLLIGETKNWRKSFLMEYYSFENPFPWLMGTDYKALRNERYKYIHWVMHPDQNELYDLIKDPLEQNNLFFDQTSRKTIKKMEKELARQVAESFGSYSL